MPDLLIDSILQRSVQQFIKDHENDDGRSLILKHKIIAGVASSLVAEQIAGRRKSKTKLPTFYRTDNIIYPPGLNLEQCSSEATARFKSDLGNTGKTFIDLTGGYGVDTFFISKHFADTFYIEPDSALLKIVQHNHNVLGGKNIKHINTSAEDFIATGLHKADVVFIDPSRRSDQNKKVVKLSDCVPDITQLQDKIFEHATTLLVKTSPLLDLQQGLKELKFVKKIIVVSVENDCKEVLFLCVKHFNNEPVVEAVNILKDNSIDSFSFLVSEEKNTNVIFSEPMLYLYEPNASILKAGAFKGIASKFNIYKIHASTHLYTADSLFDQFPGRVFKIEALIKTDSKIIKQYFPEGKANISTRNYPLTPVQLKKKTGLKDGGEKYLIGFTGQQQKYLAVATRVI
jgi:16S rRNA G966 N2-methylase RsmD